MVPNSSFARPVPGLRLRQIHCPSAASLCTSTAPAASATQHQWYAVCRMLYAVCCLLYAVCCMLACARCRVQVCRTVSADRRRGGIGCTHETGLWAGRSERCIRRSLPASCGFPSRGISDPVPSVSSTVTGCSGFVSFVSSYLERTLALLPSL